MGEIITVKEAEKLKKDMYFEGEVIVDGLCMASVGGSESISVINETGHYFSVNLQDFPFEQMGGDFTKVNKSIVMKITIADREEEEVE